MHVMIDYWQSNETDHRDMDNDMYSIVRNWAYYAIDNS